jgi:DNA-binding transcriptional MerR regulator
MVTDPEASGLTLSELAAASGQEPRTIRSWVAQGLLPPPRNRGPAARYPADMLQRVLAIVAMRELLGMSLSDIRLDLLSASPEKIAGYAARFANVPQKAERTATDPRGALEYLAKLNTHPTSPEPTVRQRSVDVGTGGLERLTSLNVSPPTPRAGLDALEHRLGGPKPAPARRPRTEEWLRIPITPDLELSARGPLDPEQRAQLERCAALIRINILGGQL